MTSDPRRYATLTRDISGKALVRLGATRAEVEEALAVAVYMGGGPSLMYSANAMLAFGEFSRASEQATA